MAYQESKNTIIKKPKILIIAGPTASGKTKLGIELAKHFNGEIISADSRQVYRGLDIGSAKATLNEQEGVPHHLLDVADINENYSVVQYVNQARITIKEISDRGMLPIIVGGTGFYIDSLLYNVKFPEVKANDAMRLTREAKSCDELFDELSARDQQRAAIIDRSNKVRLIRALEIVDELGSVPLLSDEHNISPYEYQYYCLNLETEQHQKIIIERIRQRWDAMVSEIVSLLNNGTKPERLEGFGLEYRFVTQYILSNLDIEQSVHGLAHATKKFIKRQYTWWKRHHDVMLVHPINDRLKIEMNINEFLKQKNTND